MTRDTTHPTLEVTMVWVCAVVLVVGTLAGCATVPAGPSVLVLPGTGKSIEQFRTDDAACRLMAAQPQGSARVPTQREYDIAYVQCMYAKGHQVPALSGTPMRSAPPPGSSTPRVPPPPAGSPPPPPPGPTR